MSKEAGAAVVAIVKKGGCIVGAGIALALLCGLWFSSNSPLFNTVVAGKFLYYHAVLAGRFLRTGTWGDMVVPGTGGWLYYGKDLREILQPWFYAKENIETIAALSDTLGRRGITLLVVPVPDKEAIMQTYSRFTVKSVSNQRVRFLRSLRERHVKVIDLTPTYLAANPKDALFQKKDVHWDGQGIAVAAREIADSVNRLPGEAGPSRYSSKDTVVDSPGFLAMFLGDSSLYPTSCRMITDAGGNPFKDSVRSDILIWGDSFTMVNRAYGGGLGAQIALYTGRPTFTIGHIGDINARAPAEMLKFLKDRPKMPKIIVWVFTSFRFMNRFE